MKNLNSYIIVLISILIASCKCDCPDSYLFDADKVPNWVKEDIDMYDVASMTFLNDEGDTLSLSKDYSSRTEINRGLIRQVECKEDVTAMVDVYYDRTWNRVFFVSDNNDSLGFQYYTQLPSLGRFSYEDFDQINEGESFPFFANYRNVMFKIEGLQYSLTLQAREKGPSVFKTFLNEDYKVLDVSFSDVFYNKHPTVPINVYFTDEVGIVGMEDLYGVKWIRLL
ncbi:MAG: hypothetical protein ACJATI_003781 [Halioglobus sp.]|jgi:hypothetical protein